MPVRPAIFAAAGVLAAALSCVPAAADDTSFATKAELGKVLRDGCTVERTAATDTPGSWKWSASSRSALS